MATLTCFSLVLLASLIAASAAFSSNSANYQTLPPSIFTNFRPTRIMVVGAEYVQNTKLRPPFFGYIARVGSSVNITCKYNSTSDLLYVTRILDDGTTVKQNVTANGSRITQARDGSYLNTTINDLQLGDSGRYHCVDDFKQLAVLNPDRPASVTGHQCISHSFNDLECEFYTNCTMHHLMEWHVRWSIRERRLCKQGPCKDMVCRLTTPENLLDVSKITRSDRLQRVRCIVKGFLFVGVSYEFTIVGNNSMGTTVAYVSTTLNSSIVLLKPPRLISYTTNATKIKLKAQLNESGSAVSHVEQGIQLYGLRYSITYESNRYQGHDSKVVNSTTSELSITKLFPYTVYSISLKYQMSNTINPDLWSSATTASIRTSELNPWAAPIISPVGFSFLPDLHGECAEDHRRVMLYWKAVKSEPGAGNGVITSYTVFNLASSANVTKDHDSIIYDDPELLAEVTGNETSASACVDGLQHALGVTAQNSAGSGPVTPEVKIPSAAQRVKLEACEISVMGDRDNGYFSISWNKQETPFDYTVFMCRPDKTDGTRCEQGTLSWQVVTPDGNSSSRLTYNPDYFSYKFGLVRWGSDLISSGIVWTSCVSDLSVNLEPAQLTVLINGVKAQVEVRDECVLNKQLSQSYLLHYCLYDAGEKECLEPEQTVMMSRCLMAIEFTLLQHSSDYAFWLDSTNDITVRSAIYVKRTGMRELETWEIALIVVFVFIFITIISISSVFAHKQMMKVKAFKSPQIVIPTQLMIEEENESDAGGNTVHDQKSLMDEYLTFDLAGEEQEMTTLQPVTESVTRPLLSDDSFSHSEPDYYSLGARPRQRSSAPSDEPLMKEDTDDSGETRDKLSCYSKMLPSLSSYRELPEEYLQCTAIEPDFNLSGGSFYNDPMSDGIIDISKYLLEPEIADEPAKLSVDIPTCPAPLGGEPSSKQMFVDLPHMVSDDTQTDKLKVDLPDTEKSEPSGKTLCIDLPPRDGSPTVASNDNYMVDTPYQTLSSDLTDYVNSQEQCSSEQNDEGGSDSTSCKSQDHSISSSVEISGGTSGDSGYDGPNLRNVRKSNINQNDDTTEPDDRLEDVGG